MQWLLYWKEGSSISVIHRIREKSYFPQLFFVAAKIQRGRLHVTVVASCPRQSIIAYHIWTKMGLSAISVADLTIENDRGTLHDFSKYLVKLKRRLHK